MNTKLQIQARWTWNLVLVLFGLSVMHHTRAQKATALPQQLQGFVLLGAAQDELLWYRFDGAPSQSQPIQFQVSSKTFEIRKTYTLNGFPNMLSLSRDSLLRFVKEGDQLAVIISPANQPEQLRKKQFKAPWAADGDPTFELGDGDETSHMCWYKRSLTGGRLLDVDHHIWLLSRNLKVFQEEMLLSKSYPRIKRMIEEPFIDISNKRDLILTYPWNGAIFHFRYAQQKFFAYGEHYLSVFTNRINREKAQTAMRGQHFMFSALIRTSKEDSLLVFNTKLRDRDTQNKKVGLSELLQGKEGECGPLIKGYQLLGLVHDRGGEKVVLLGQRKDPGNPKRAGIFSHLLLARFGEDLQLIKTDLIHTSAFEKRDLLVVQPEKNQDLQVILSVPSKGEKKGWTRITPTKVGIDLQGLQPEKAKGVETGLEHISYTALPDLKQAFITAPAKGKRWATYRLSW